MKTPQKLRTWQLLSVIGYGVMSGSLMFAYSDPSVPGYKAPYVLAGILFWVGSLSGGGFQLLLWRKLRQKLNGRVGLLRFFCNKFGAAADLLLAISLIGVILTLIFGSRQGFWATVIWSLFIFSFSMHCVLNGRKFQYIYSSYSQTANKEECKK